MPGPRSRLRRQRRGPRRFSSKKKSVARLSPPMRRAVKAIVRGDAETKHTTFYESFNDGTITTRASGFYSARGWAVHNQSLTSNPLDILQVIPYVIQGTGDTNRIGSKIRVANLKVNGAVRVSIDRLSLLNLTNVKVVIFVWQHVSLRDYTNLYANNDWSYFLEDGEGNTRTFNGEQQNLAMRVNSQTYKICVRRVIPLKYAGLTPPSAGGAPAGIANSHVWKADYSFDLTRFVPKVLTYPEVNGTISPPPQTLNAPTNSSLAMSVAFLLDNNPSNTAGTPYTALPLIENTYVSEIGFKDS